MFKTKQSKLVLLSFVFIGLTILGLYTIKLFEENKKKYYLNVQSELFQTKYNTSYKYLKVMSSDIAQMYSRNKKLIALLEETKDGDNQKLHRIRDKAYSLLIKNYTRLNKMGVSQVHFHLPNNISFLRMNKPSHYGDNVTNVLGSVAKTNTTLTPHEGFEVSQYISGIHFVYPLLNSKNEHLGSVKISYSSNKLLKSIKDEFTYDSHILISKSILENTHSVHKLNENYVPSWEVPTYYLDKSTHNTLNYKSLYKDLHALSFNNEELLNDIVEGIKTEKTFTVSTLYNYQNILLTYLPLPNASGIKNISYIVAYTESDYLSNVQMEENYIKLVYFVIITLLTLFTIYVIYSQEKLKVLALYDNLTKLPNRTLFTIEFENEINRALRYKDTIALLFLDLDGFKEVNDTYGHGIGDQLLIRVAKIITSNIRKNDIVSRLGGDEFTIILADVHSPKKALEVSQNIIQEISKDIVIGHKVIKVGASIGISMFPDDAQDTQSLMKYADDMMYISKANGKNQVTLYKKEEQFNV